MAAYYNEIDPFAAQWLRNLISSGHIAPGDVDERSIEDVQAADLTGYAQCHFFAGIGGWSHALRLAGWPDDRPVWTGSPPCQPFSTAGKQLGKDDARHLAPAWLDLVSECKPPVLFGEQVAAAIKEHWLDDLQAHLEAEDYACGAIVLPACGVGAPHIRQRLWIVAERLGDGGEPGLERLPRDGNDVDESRRDNAEPSGSATETGASAGGLANHNSTGPQPWGETSEAARYRDTTHTESGADRYGRPGPTNGHWRAADWLKCRDGKWRPVEPGTFPLADGIPERLADVLSCWIKAKKRIDQYAEETKTNPDKAMRVVREILLAQTSGEEQPIRVRVKFHAPALLLALLLGAEAARDGSTDSCGFEKKSKKAVERAMRCMRSDSGSVPPPHRRKPDEQFDNEPTDALYKLSFILARDVETYREKVYRANAALGRVNMLKAYGNAIVPQVAAEVIISYLLLK